MESMQFFYFVLILIPNIQGTPSIYLMNSSFDWISDLIRSCSIVLSFSRVTEFSTACNCWSLCETLCSMIHFLFSSIMVMGLQTVMLRIQLNSRARLFLVRVYFKRLSWVSFQQIQGFGFLRLNSFVFGLRSACSAYFGVRKRSKLFDFISNSICRKAFLAFQKVFARILAIILDLLLSRSRTFALFDLSRPFSYLSLSLKYNSLSCYFIVGFKVRTDSLRLFFTSMLALFAYYGGFRVFS